MFADSNAQPAPDSPADGGSHEQRETRHLVNRLRLEFRTASQLQLEAAVAHARKASDTYAGEKILQLARAALAQSLAASAEALARAENLVPLEGERPRSP